MNDAKENSIEYLSDINESAQQELGNAQLALSLALDQYGKAEADLAAARALRDQAMHQFRTAAIYAGAVQRSLQIAEGVGR